MNVHTHYIFAEEAPFRIRLLVYSGLSYQASSFSSKQSFLSVSNVTPITLEVYLPCLYTVSEVGWPASFFDRFFPVLGRSFGLGALGIFQCL